MEQIDDSTKAKLMQVISFQILLNAASFISHNDLKIKDDSIMGEPIYQYLLVGSSTEQISHVNKRHLIQQDIQFKLREKSDCHIPRCTYNNSDLLEYIKVLNNTNKYYPENNFTKNAIVIYILIFIIFR